MNASHLSFLVSCLLPVTAVAQDSPGFSVAGAVLYADVSGDDFQGTNAGFGFDAQGRYSWGAFSLGAGFHYTTHDLEGLSDNLGVRGFFVEPRYAFNAGSPSLVPYLTGRLSLVKEKVESGPDKAEASGTAIGGGGGLLVRLGPTVHFDVSVTYAAVSFGDFELNGSTVPDSDTSGSSLALRAGVSVRLSK